LIIPILNINNMVNNMSKVNLDLKINNPNALFRKDLKPGVIFIYNDYINRNNYISNKNEEIFMVPDSSFSRHNVDNKDIMIGGEHSGMLEDYHPDLEVIELDITAVRHLLK
jgi:hypothetical protein